MDRDDRQTHRPRARSFLIPVLIALIVFALIWWPTGELGSAFLVAGVVGGIGLWITYTWNERPSDAEHPPDAERIRGGQSVDVVVDGTPESCLTQVEAYFARDWTYGGAYSRPTPNTVRMFATRRTLFDSGGGFLLLLFLGLITAGAFFVIYIVYWIVMDRTYEAQVMATPEEEGRTRLTVTSNRRDWAEALETWVQQELVENKAAAVAPSTEHPTDSSGIADQIKQLAELRNVGAITDEEFERKKAELLDRM